MNEPVVINDRTPRLNMKLLKLYLIPGALLAVVGLAYVSLNFNPRYVFAALTLLVAFLIIASPCLALYQYIFLLFIDYMVVPSVPLMLIDISACLVILAALVDVLVSDRPLRRLPNLSFNYFYIITAILCCALLSYQPEMAIRPLARITILTLTFLAAYRLMNYTSVSRLLSFFFALAVLHSAYVLTQFVVSGGLIRSFGFTRVVFDDQAMVALPVGIALYLGSSPRTGSRYLLGSIVVLGAIIATQSRAPIAMALAASLFVVGVVHFRVKKAESDDPAVRFVKRRIAVTISIAVVATIVVTILSSGILATVFNRFEQLLSARPSGSTIYRLALWNKALMAFSDHPVFGIGPGMFRFMHQVYFTLHLTPAYDHISRLSAHNLMLHYLAEMGLVGGIGLIALFVNQFRLARHSWLRQPTGWHGPALAIYGWAFLFALSTLIEAAWMWGQLSFMAIFFAALVARNYKTVSSQTSQVISH